MIAVMVMLGCLNVLGGSECEVPKEWQHGYVESVHLTKEEAIKHLSPLVGARAITKDDTKFYYAKDVYLIDLDKHMCIKDW